MTYRMKVGSSSRGVGRRALFGALLFVLAGSAFAQKPKLPDEARLRAQFLAVFGNDFNLLKSEFKTRGSARGGGTYWLAYLEPKRTGYFYLQHSYKDTSGLYSHVEQEIHLGVGPKGCHRGAPYTGIYTRFCLGDTIIVPMLFNDFQDHQFKLVKAEYSAGDQNWETSDNPYPETRDQRLDQMQFENPAAESLRYVGRKSELAPLRSLGYTIYWRAVFEAVNPGRFNLEVSSAAPEVDTGVRVPGGVPIIVVSRDTPLVLIAGQEEVRGFRKGYDGRETLVSSSGNNYTMSLMILQPGDRLSIVYYSVTRHREPEGDARADLDPSDPAADVRPVIRAHQFSLKEQYDFSEWVIDYLPK